jgi:hypothetical protein
VRQETEAELGAQSDARFEHTREHLYAFLQKATRQEAEAALHKDRRELDRYREDLWDVATRLEARDAAISARENAWARQRNRAVALRAVPAVVLTATIQAVL